jgi:hypothetical protein
MWSSSNIAVLTHPIESCYMDYIQTPAGATIYSMKTYKESGRKLGHHLSQKEDLYRLVVGVCKWSETLEH